jgi:hypothetical protein
MNIERIGVIGAGQMGNGIAHVCALAGYDVLINDVKRERIDAAFEIISGNLSRQVARGKISDAEKDKALKRIHAAPSLDEFEKVDLAIEAATEDEKVKKQIFRDLCPKLSKNAMIATNTSSISITRLAAVTDRPERFIGLHFMNPVPLMQLVELIRGIATEEETFTTVHGLVKRLGKTSANSEDFPAFIVNRHAARREPSDGTAAACRLHRARYVFVGDAGALRGPCRLEVPSLPALGEVRGSRVARPEDEARLLRLSRREAGADALTARARGSGLFCPSPGDAGGANSFQRL